MLCLCQCVRVREVKPCTGVIAGFMSLFISTLLLITDYIMQASGRGQVGTKRKHSKDSGDSGGDDSDSGGDDSDSDDKWTPDKHGDQERGSGRRGGRLKKKKTLVRTREIDHDEARLRTCVTCLSVCSKAKIPQGTRDLRDNAVMLSRCFKFISHWELDLEDYRLPVGWCTSCRLRANQELNKDAPSFNIFDNIYDRFLNLRAHLADGTIIFRSKRTVFVCAGVEQCPLCANSISWDVRHLPPFDNIVREPVENRYAYRDTALKVCNYFAKDLILHSNKLFIEHFITCYVASLSSCNV